jgi:hypothetical protein
LRVESGELTVQSSGFRIEREKRREPFDTLRASLPGGQALATRPRKNPRMMRGGDALNVMVWGKRVGNFVP